MDLQFIIQTLGYITAEFQIEGEKIKIGHSSAYGDKFQELLNGLFLIYNSSEEEDRDFFPYSFEVIWYDDRVNYSWLVTARTNTEIEIKVFELSPSNPSYRVELLKQSITFNALFNTIYLSLEKMLKAFGFIGYKINWDAGNFPLYEYLRLKSYKYNLELHKQEITEDDEWRCKVPIEDEMNLVLLDL